MSGRVEKRVSDGDLGKMGERATIEVIRRHLDVMPKSPVPFGDDVAAIPLEGERLAVLKTDMLVDKTDVPVGMSLRQAARKAVVMNVSDFASKGVQPLAVMVSLGLPRTLRKRDVEEIADGLNLGAREYGAFVVGGDTGEASDVVMAVSVFGTALKSKLVLRSGAKAGDLLAVTGLFGKPPAGLRLLSSQCKVSSKLRKALVESVLMPRAKLKEGLALAASGALTSSIDSSDGLAWSLHELSRMSNVGFVVDKVPLADEVVKFAERCGDDALELALYGGEEYELVVTVNPKNWREAEDAVEGVGGNLFSIGQVTKEKDIMLELDGERKPIQARGWEHFKSAL